MVAIIITTIIITIMLLLLKLLHLMEVRLRLYISKNTKDGNKHTA